MSLKNSESCHKLHVKEQTTSYTKVANILQVWLHVSSEFLCFSNPVRVCDCSVLSLTLQNDGTADGMWNAAPTSSCLSAEIQHIFVPKTWIQLGWRAASQDFKLPPSLVAVKAFQQTAGKTTFISWEKCAWPSAEREEKNAVLKKMVIRHPPTITL